MDILRKALDEGNNNLLVLTWGGTETVLVFDLKTELAEFAAFTIPFQEPTIQTELERIFYDKIVAIAIQANVPLLLDAATWRASPDYIQKLGYHQQGEEGEEETLQEVVYRINQAAVDAMKRIKKKWSPEGLISIVAAELGPRGDGYKAETIMSIHEAETYHSVQIAALAKCGVELIHAITLTYFQEAIGIAIAASKVNIPVVISPTVETNGKLPDQKTSLGDFILTVDQALSERNHTIPLYYMVNCAHPTHIEKAFEDCTNTTTTTTTGCWRNRIKGIRANASRCSHAELDEATELDSGDPDEFGKILAEWNQTKGIMVVGGCCGTDARHIEKIIHYRFSSSGNHFESN